MNNIPRFSFRKFHRYRPLRRYLESLVAAAPRLCRLHKIGESRAGRDILAVEICNRATGPAEEKPAYAVHANIHAVEVAGSSAATYTCYHLLNNYQQDERVTDLVDSIAFYVVPRLNPDGAEYALRTGGPIRSRTEPRELVDGLQPCDLNGDGLILSMRWQDPAGEWKLHPDDTRRLVPREAKDLQGPFYRMATEGLIRQWQGGPIRTSGRSLDFNRNWPANWRPEHQQSGAGDYPFSEPETKAFGDFVLARPNIFGLLGFHTGSNSVLRSPATGSDDDLLESDLRIMKEIGAVGAELTGFTLRPVIHYKKDEDKPISLQGHFTDWGYFHLGLFVFEIELGNLWNSVGIKTEEYFAADDQKMREYEARQLEWHEQHPKVGAFVDWEPFDHPQLGPVEIGGWHPVWRYNPYLTDLAEIAPKCAQFICEHAARRPRIAVVKTRAEHIEGRVYRVKSTVLNSGGLPTNVTEWGTRLRSLQPVSVELKPLKGAEVLSSAALVEIGQLGRAGGHRTVEWFARRTGKSSGKLEIVARAQKGGVARTTVTLPPAG